ncbi:DUF4386 domain-containing protein [Granulicella sibirica]|uniref:DUF4386 domain-containing protein n=1 Tax=Granulicella sibirica TaxID=2479048 RepID=A0A4Q0SXD1_9BACT|nr:DUF4386 domain-containing protein [Granulicella sibirica]RXH55783.1 hypothetical protein GRAN_2640 [Granulicella sibirica]
MTAAKRTISPQVYARLSGVLYLINIACGLFGEVTRGKLIIPGDPAATAHHILASESLFRLTIAGDLVMHITDVPMAILFYVLLKPVSKDLSALAALFGMLQTAILCANKLNLITVLFLLTGNGLQSFTPSQLQSFASLSLELHESGFGVGLIFFGVSCLITAYLLYRSEYFPKALGILQAMAGVSYLINSFTLILNPTLATRMFPAIVIPAFIGELATCLWLITKGINVTKWNHRIAAGPLIQGPADA